MNYIVVELQTSGGVTSSITTTFDNRNEAESNVETHAAVMLSQEGSPERYEFYNHEVVINAD